MSLEAGGGIPCRSNPAPATTLLVTSLLCSLLAALLKRLTIKSTCCLESELTRNDWQLTANCVYVWLTDIDECASDICHNGNCVNSPGSFQCLCPDGYQLSHTGDECQGQHYIQAYLPTHTQAFCEVTWWPHTGLLWGHVMTTHRPTVRSRDDHTQAYCEATYVQLIPFDVFSSIWL